MTSRRKKQLQGAGAILGLICFCWLISAVSRLNVPVVTVGGLVMAPLLAMAGFRYTMKLLAPKDSPK